jgi:hypothetical protein
MAICVAILTALGTLALLFRLFFRDLDDFQECLDLAFGSKLSWVLTDWGEELLAWLKFGAWIGSGGIVGLGVWGLEHFSVS